MHRRSGAHLQHHRSEQRWRQNSKITIWPINITAQLHLTPIGIQLGWIRRWRRRWIRAVCRAFIATSKACRRKHRSHKRQGDKQSGNNALQHVASFELLFDLWPAAPQHSRIMQRCFLLLRPCQMKVNKCQTQDPQSACEKPARATKGWQFPLDRGL